MPKAIFFPEQKEIQIEKGITIMKAAEKAGVYINSLCGGNGVCGKCKVQITGGDIRADKNSISFLWTPIFPKLICIIFLKNILS